MTNTPYRDVASQDILSAHISGIQHSVNKIETVLNMKTLTKTGHALVPVTDQADPTLHYFIYEGTVRNWLESPAPVIKRNGVVVDPSEYALQAAYGVIVFHVQQGAEYAITADFTHIDGDSTVIDDLTTGLSTANTNISTANTNITTLDGRVTAIEGKVGGQWLPEGYLIPKGDWITNFRSMSDPETLYATGGIAMAANTIDAQPFYVYEKTTISKIKFTIGENTSPAGNAIVGIYSNLNTAPKTLLASTPVIAVAATTGTRVDYEVNLNASVTLDPGMYWVARYQSAGIKPVGAPASAKCILIKPPTDATLLNASGTISPACVGVRTTSVGSISTLPATFNAMNQSTCQYLKRDDYGVTWLFKA